MPQGYFYKFWYSLFLTSDKLRLSVTGEYKDQSPCAFTWYVRNTVESWKRDVRKETSEGTAAWCWKLIWNSCSAPSLLLPTPTPWQHCNTEQSVTSGTALLKRSSIFLWDWLLMGWSPWFGWPQWRIWEFSSGSKGGGRVCSFQWQFSLGWWNHGSAIIQQTTTCSIWPEYFAKGTHCRRGAKKIYLPWSAISLRHIPWALKGHSARQSILLVCEKEVYMGRVFLS